MKKMKIVSLFVICIFAPLHLLAEGTIKLSPKVHQSKVRYRDTKVEFDIKPFIVPFRMFDVKEVLKFPKVATNIDGLSGKTNSLFVVEDFLSTIEELDIDVNVREYAIYRVNDAEYHTKKDDELIGVGAVEIATAQVIQVENEDGHTVFKIDRATNEVLKGDILLPKDNKLTDLKPIQLDRKVSGFVIDTINSIHWSGLYQYVFVDVGSAQGAKPGHLFVVRANPNYSSDFIVVNEDTSSKIDQIQLDASIGSIILIKVYDHGSYGLITKTNGGIRKFDFISNQ